MQASVGRSRERLRALGESERDYRTGRRRARDRVNGGYLPAGTVPGWLKEARGAARAALDRKRRGAVAVAAVFRVRRRAAERARAYLRGVWVTVSGFSLSFGIGEDVAGYVAGPGDVPVVLQRLRHMVRRVASCLPAGALRGCMAAYRALVRVASCGSMEALWAMAHVGTVK